MGGREEVVCKSSGLLQCLYPCVPCPSARPPSVCLSVFIWGTSAKGMFMKDISQNENNRVLINGYTLNKFLFRMTERQELT